MKKNHFTLIEVLIVVAIVSIIGAICVDKAFSKKSSLPIPSEVDGNKVVNEYKNGKFNVKQYNVDTWRDGEIREITDTETGIVYTIYSKQSCSILLNTSKKVSSEK